MGIPLRLLMVEDSEDDSLLIVRELRRADYDVTYERVDTRASMSTAVNRQSWDLIICDHSMPNFSGIEALKMLRATGSTAPFIFVSGTIGEETAVNALKMGAQDYVMKTNLARLLPAVRRELQEVIDREERKKLETQVQQLQKFEAIGRLAGGIAHDFNNALRVIIGWAQLGLDAASDAGSKEKFRTIHDQAQRAAGLTSQLLAFARRQVLRPRKLDLNHLVAQTINLLRSVIGAGIEVNLILAKDLYITQADPTQVEQVIMNLCLNARDAMPHGGRLIVETENHEVTNETAKVHSHAKPGSYVLLTISDTGIGMDKATSDHVFEPFFTTKEPGKGTGLGLATVYGIVKQHNGFLDVYSEPGRGTSFRVYLPSSSGIPEVGAGSTSDVVVAGTETILIAEDHPALREIAHQVLSSAGYHVLLAKDGEEAVQLVKQDPGGIDLLLVDIAMPRLSGAEAYRQICSLKPGLPVIFSTGFTAESASLTSEIKQGAVFLQKPYTPKTLAQTVRLTLDRKRND